MSVFDTADFIKAPPSLDAKCPVFEKAFSLKGPVRRALLHISARGLYEAHINGARVGNFVFAPGWTSYNKRLQYQSYDVLDKLASENGISVTVGPGWCAGRMGWENRRALWADTPSFIAALELEYADGASELVCTGPDWTVARGPLLMSEIYDGEDYDARVGLTGHTAAVKEATDKSVLIPQQGEKIVEYETLPEPAIIHTPAGETVLDFGENLTGYVTFRVKAHAGELIEYDHAEVLDAAGNFYTDNLRSAKQRVRYICAEGENSYKPHFSFFGFRYVRINSWPVVPETDMLRAVRVCSDLKRTGHFECSDERVNRLYGNAVRSQLGNYLDVPTDCPQRDERLGWLGDAQVFIRTAAMNFDVQRFFDKWLSDLAADQYPDGGMPHVIPDALTGGASIATIEKADSCSSCGWGDAAVVCPWELYLAYGDKRILDRQFDSMRAWVEYIRAQGDDEYLWNTGEHFGDWLGLDSPPDSYKGATDDYLIATAFYAYSTGLLVKAGRVLGRDMTEYERLYDGIVAAFNREFVSGGRIAGDTQTGYALALHFDLVSDKAPYAARLNELILQNGGHLKTGFIGTAYLLDALARNGYAATAYTLLLRDDFPSWLYALKLGATTIWEHWDNIRPDGSFWSADMNSFNHYAYGAVAGWMYGTMAGINTDPAAPGYERIIFRPIPDDRLDFVKASILTRRGPVAAQWRHEGGCTVYEFTVPEGSSAVFESPGGQRIQLNAGKHKVTE